LTCKAKREASEREPDWHPRLGATAIRPRGWLSLARIGTSLHLILNGNEKGAGAGDEDVDVEMDILSGWGEGTERGSCKMSPMSLCEACANQLIITI